MPIQTTQKSNKRDFKQEFLEMITQKYGYDNAMVMDKALKTQDKQIEQAMMEGGMTAEQIGQSKGIQIEQKPASSPFGFGGMKQEDKKFVEQKPGFLASLLGTVFTGTPTPGARMDIQNLMRLAELQKTQQGQITPEKQINTLLQTQQKLKELGINAGINVTATGVPTITTQPTLGIEDLTSEQQIQVVDLAKRIGGVRGAAKLVPSIAQGVREGKTIDQIDDELRFSQQSPEFAGTMREAAQQITIGESKEVSNRVFDYLDDLVQRGDQEEAKSFLKRMAIKNAGQTQQQNIMGQERTIDLLGEIQNDLQTLEKEGFPTGFFSGNIEKLMGKVGQVKNPKHRELATKIAVAVMQYRRDMTGVQFGMKEHTEYKAIFPGIDKIGRFNMSAIKALKDTFGGNINKFYSLSMGEKNYKKLFGGDYKIKTEETKQFDFSNMSREELLKRRNQLLGGGQ